MQVKRSQYALLLIASAVFGFSAIHTPSVRKFAAKKSVKKQDGEPQLDFNRDLRPILSEKCFTCHGADPKAVRAGLKLNDPKVATHALKDGVVAIVPGNPSASEVVKRIEASSPDDRMPPPDSNKILTTEEKKTIETWIAQGAKYEGHWAFAPLERPSLPPVKDKGWVKTPIDQFVLANLESKGLKPSQPADKATLLRRVSLDITGLPPSQAQLDAFLADKSPNAYEKVVDRLLASPRYGERMAMDWMDYARYADSNGYQSDWERYQYRWRDWVIDAFNSNMPYDQFTIKQLAGDLLPHPTLNDLIATGFNRNHRINTEGGVIPEEWRVENVIDRASTTGAVWLGLTVGCARCHDHKFDPITQEDFYSLCAFFNNVPESGTGVEAPVNHPPFIQAPYPNQITEKEGLTAKMVELQAQMRTLEASHYTEGSEWAPSMVAAPKIDSTGLVARYRFAEGLTPPSIRYVGKPKFDFGRSTGAVRTDGMTYGDLGQAGDFEGDKPFSYALWIYPQSGGSPISKMDVGHDYRGWDLHLESGRPAVHIINKWPDTAIKVIGQPMLPSDQWSHVTVTYDGSQKAKGVSIYVDGKKVGVDVAQDTLKGSIRTTVSAKIGRRTGADEFTGKVDDLLLLNRALTADEAARLASVDPAQPWGSIPVAERTISEKRMILQAWARANLPAYKALYEKLTGLQAQFTALNAAIPTVMIMADMPKQRPAYVLVRGQYDHHGTPVTARIPLVFGKLPAKYPNNRLGLAEWIVSPENPLTLRVTVNRFWSQFFGIGLVETVEDFGTRASYPTNLPLLNWMSTEFLRLHWNVKAMLKEIVMSNTYQQSSDIPPELEKIDPENKLLARGPRFRLQAEMIRDQAMFFGGMITQKIGGPSVYPYQPQGIWDETSVYGNMHNYKHAIGPDLHRRSIYTIWKRTAAPPNMTLFDVPSREICTMRRARTDTPMQALDLMDDETYIESARALAQKILAAKPASPAARIDEMFRTVLCRTPSKQELTILKKGLMLRLAHYKANEKAAQRLIAIGDWPRPKNYDPAVLASYTLTADTILNLDETITKD